MMPVKTVGILERAEDQILDLGERMERVRTDRLLSTLKLLGIMEHLPKDQVDRALVKLRDIEDVDRVGAPIDNRMPMRA